MAGKAMRDHGQASNEDDPVAGDQVVEEILNRSRHWASLSATRREISMQSATEFGFSIQGTLLSVIVLGGRGPRRAAMRWCARRRAKSSCSLRIGGW
jgi:hypothetical protein